VTDATSSTKTDEVLNTVRSIIQEVVGDDYEMLGPIDLTTSFNNDLELESIELVAMAEKLQERYGEKVNFVDWMSKKSLDEMVGLTVGELVAFIVKSLA
jgi:acyl carrier protein